MEVCSGICCDYLIATATVTTLELSLQILFLIPGVPPPLRILQVVHTLPIRSIECAAVLPMVPHAIGWTQHQSHPYNVNAMSVYVYVMV